GFDQLGPGGQLPDGHVRVGVRVALQQKSADVLVDLGLAPLHIMLRLSQHLIIFFPQVFKLDLRLFHSSLSLVSPWWSRRCALFAKIRAVVVAAAPLCMS